MVSQKLVRLSVLVLVLAVMVTNAKRDDRGGGRGGGGGGGGRPSREQMALGVLCLNCPNVTSIVSQLRTCLTNAKVDTSVATGTGVQCLQGIRQNGSAAFANADKTQLAQCAQQLEPNQSAIRACFEQTIPRGSRKGPGPGPGPQ